MMLGTGQEGVVTLENDLVCKRFRPDALTDGHVEWLQGALRGVAPFLPEPSWRKVGGSWELSYPWFASQAVEKLTLDELREFFLFCLQRNLICANIKHANFRRRPGGGLTFVDIGAWLVPMDVDYFRDACARGFVLAEIGWTDDDLRQRSKELRDEGVLRSLPGFASYYSSILHEYAQRQWAAGVIPAWPKTAAAEPRVTLLLKACAMDAAALAVQVRHIVGQLEHPRRFAERVLALDPFRGPFLRQHCEGNWAHLLEDAEHLRRAGWLDRVLIAPDDVQNTTAINERWFNLACPHTHCIRGVPVTPQLWGFDQVCTRYVLQCDADVLIGRRDITHDYLGDMLEAAASPDALGVAFNIPHAPDSTVRRYDAPPGEFVPEIRCGLLDLERIDACRPLPNSIKDGRLALTWYRSLQKYQQIHSLRTLRGGDSRTFFVHPPNSWKGDTVVLDRVRDLVSQGVVPPVQAEHWDICGSPDDWRYQSRHEAIVFLLKGRNTTPLKVERCLRSLAGQDDQNFGIVLVDDASEADNTSALSHLLGPFAGRCTLVCRSRNHGRLPNILLAVRDICANPETLVVVLDLDDALISRSAVRKLRSSREDGADVVLGAMFRTDKPLKLYHPDLTNARAKWGGEVWIHLRSFRKRLFDALPFETLQLDGQWIEHCTDYATMIPLVELADKPVYLREYLYFHERSTLPTPDLQAMKDGIIRQILAKADLGPTIVETGEQAEA